MTPEERAKQLSDAFKGFLMIIALCAAAVVCTCSPIVGLIAHFTN
jgi:hypothetical protein